MIKNKRQIRKAQQLHYQQSCKEEFDSYLALENSFSDLTNDYGVRITRVASELGPIVKVSFPERDDSGEKCLTDLYKGMVGTQDGKVFVKATLEDFYEANDVWVEGFVMKDGLATKINPANVSEEHWILINNLRNTFKEKYAEQSKDSNVELQ